MNRGQGRGGMNPHYQPRRNGQPANLNQPRRRQQVNYPRRQVQQAHHQQVRQRRQVYRRRYVPPAVPHHLQALFQANQLPAIPLEYPYPGDGPEELDVKYFEKEFTTSILLLGMATSSAVWTAFHVDGPSFLGDAYGAQKRGKKALAVQPIVDACHVLIFGRAPFRIYLTTESQRSYLKDPSCLKTLADVHRWLPLPPVPHPTHLLKAFYYDYVVIFYAMLSGGAVMSKDQFRDHIRALVNSMLPPARKKQFIQFLGRCTIEGCLADKGRTGENGEVVTGSRIALSRHPGTNSLFERDLAQEPQLLSLVVEHAVEAGFHLYPATFFDVDPPTQLSPDAQNSATALSQFIANNPVNGGNTPPFPMALFVQELRQMPASVVGIIAGASKAIDCPDTQYENPYLLIPGGGWACLARCYPVSDLRVGDVVEAWLDHSRDRVLYARYLSRRIYSLPAGTRQTLRSFQVVADKLQICASAEFKDRSATTQLIPGLRLAGPFNVADGTGEIRFEIRAVPRHARNNRQPGQPRFVPRVIDAEYAILSWKCERPEWRLQPLSSLVRPTQRASQLRTPIPDPSIIICGPSNIDPVRCLVLENLPVVCKAVDVQNFFRPSSAAAYLFRASTTSLSALAQFVTVEETKRMLKDYKGKPFLDHSIRLNEALARSDRDGPVATMLTNLMLSSGSAFTGKRRAIGSEEMAGGPPKRARAKRVALGSAHEMEGDPSMGDVGTSTLSPGSASVSCSPQESSASSYCSGSQNHVLSDGVGEALNLTTGEGASTGRPTPSTPITEVVEAQPPISSAVSDDDMLRGLAVLIKTEPVIERASSSKAVPSSSSSVVEWSVDQVARFITEEAGEKIADIFRENELDGRGLIRLTTQPVRLEAFLTGSFPKLGPQATAAAMIDFLKGLHEREKKEENVLKPVKLEVDEGSKGEKGNPRGEEPIVVITLD